MGEEGLRPSTPPPFEKGGRKLLCFGAGGLFFSKESSVRGVPALEKSAKPISKIGRRFSHIQYVESFLPYLPVTLLKTAEDLYGFHCPIPQSADGRHRNRRYPLPKRSGRPVSRYPLH